MSIKIPDDFEYSVNILLGCRRLVVTTGVGKSGFIAQKMAATLTSTGTPAIFLDPMNALHGDLGIVSKDDVLICYSYSGEASEILALIPTVKKRGVSVISIVGRDVSSLSDVSDATIVAPIEQEACPLNLAPTTSTVVAMGISDALAVALMSEKQYKAEDFALNHPAGSLGRRLTLKVSELILEETRLVFLKENSSFKDVICSISSTGVGAICIVDDAMKVNGLITDGDIRRAVESCEGAKLVDLTAVDMMTVNPISISLDSMAVDALNLMEQRSSQISVLPVVSKEGTYGGIIRLHDLIKAGL
ncbi:MAG: KpsF/GutQ family sugar-phosphate isomerase [Alphaproteobacteria bacterium]|nr:KpsF/GutQ family sugar-phosphate isomerase [Alphaproteobacteria bacterium]